MGTSIQTSRRSITSRKRLINLKKESFIMANIRVTSFVPRQTTNAAPMAKRMSTRASARPALANIGNNRLVANNDKIAVNKRQTKVAARRIQKTEQAQQQELPPARVVALPPAPLVLPPGVKDIDLVDCDNPQLCAEYVPTMYNYLRQLERETAIKQDFLKGCSINGKMRGVLLDWLTEVHLQFKLLQETLYMTVAIIDRFLQVEGLTIRRNKLQLVGVAAMLIASKVEEMYAPEINDFVYITDNAYTATEIRALEIRILSTINFGLGRPLPLHFLRRNSKAGDVDVLQHMLAKYLMEASIVEYDMVHYSPSIMAAAALNLSLLLLEPGAKMSTCWTPALQHYSSYSHQQLVPIICKMASIILNKKSSKFQSVHTKYQSKKFLGVSQLEEFKGEKLKKLAAKNLDDL